MTVLDFLRAGTVRAGDRVTLRIRCTVGGIRHETSWQGVFATPVSATSAAVAVVGGGSQIVGPRPAQSDGARRRGHPGRRRRPRHPSQPRA